MRGFPLQLLASCVLLAVTSGALAGSKMPQQVLDLHLIKAVFAHLRDVVGYGTFDGVDIPILNRAADQH